MQDHGWIGTREACEYLGITLRTLYRYIDDGKLPAYKMGRAIRLRSEDVALFGRGQAGDGFAGIASRFAAPRPGQLDLSSWAFR